MRTLMSFLFDINIILIVAFMRIIALKLDDFPSRSGRQRPPHREIDAVLKKADASIHQQRVHSSGVIARRREDAAHDNDKLHRRGKIFHRTIGDLGIRGRTVVVIGVMITRDEPAFSSF